MRRLMRPAVLLLLVAVVTLPAAADKAKDLFNKGQDAEARQNYEAAYEFYKQAYDLKPRDLRYRASFERTRFEAASVVVHRGQKLREEGKLDEAVAEFRKALAIDSSLYIAQQELKRVFGWRPTAWHGGQGGVGGPRAVSPPGSETRWSRVGGDSVCAGCAVRWSPLRAAPGCTQRA